MYQDYIKSFFKTIGITLCCGLLLGAVSFFVFGVGKRGGQAPDLHSLQTNKIIALNTTTSTERFVEGKHYQRLPAKVTTQHTVQQFVATDPGKVQVIEFFNYACFWCQRLHPKVNEWATTKPEKVTLYRVPIVFNKGWEVMAKAYFMVQMLGQNKTLDEKFFQAIHKDNLDLGNEKLLQDFFAQQGVDQSKFLELYGSFSVSRALAQSNDLANAYQLTVSPAMIVNGPTGSYLVTASTAGTYELVLEVVSFLVEKEAKALAGASQTSIDPAPGKAPATDSATTAPMPAATSTPDAVTAPVPAATSTIPAA